MTHRWKVRKQTDRLCGARLGQETDHVYAPFSLIQPYASKSHAFLRMRCVHPVRAAVWPKTAGDRSEEHTSEPQSLMRISYAVFCLKKKTKQILHTTNILLHKPHPDNNITTHNYQTQ